LTERTPDPGINIGTADHYVAFFGGTLACAREETNSVVTFNLTPNEASRLSAALDRWVASLD
jgi:hypothetical protein